MVVPFLRVIKKKGGGKELPILLHTRINMALGNVEKLYVVLMSYTSFKLVSPFFSSFLFYLFFFFWREFSMGFLFVLRLFVDSFASVLMAAR